LSNGVTFQVVDATTDLGIPNATYLITPDGTTGQTDANGMVTLPFTLPVPGDTKITFSSPGYSSNTL
jgi:hypothetical protein